jgi:hypothetical protein
LVNRKEPAPLNGDIPKSAHGCLNSKHIKTPTESVHGGCLGSRFRVAIDRSGYQKLYMLFALQGEDWKLGSDKQRNDYAKLRIIVLWALHLTGVDGKLHPLTPARTTPKAGETALSGCLAPADAP